MAAVHVLIVGSGAVGAFYGSRLHRPDADPPVLVSVVCRSNYATVKESGFEMETHSFGSYHFTPYRVYRSVQEAAAAAAAAGSSNSFDYVVVTTKALPDISDDSELIQDVISSSSSSSDNGPSTSTSSSSSSKKKDKLTSIVLIQNGVGIEELHRLRFPDNPILSAVTVVSAAQVSQGKVVQNRWTRISVGPYVQSTSAPSSLATDGGRSSESSLERLSTERTEHFVRLLKDGGVKDAESYDEKGLQLVRWHKIAINGSMNPSSVLSGGTGNAAMSLDPETRQHLKGCMDEVLETAPKVLGRAFPKKLATAEAILKSTERNTSGKPSMLLDWEARRPMELEVILGNPVRLARAKGYEMPRLQSMYALLKLAQTRRKEEDEKQKRGEKRGAPDANKQKAKL